MEEPDTPKTALADCPNGRDDCPIYDQFQSELRRLQTRIEQLQQEAQTDGLTGLYNKRYFQQALERELERTKRTDQPTTLLLLDLDHFKQVNDRYGHVAGDAVLKSVAEVIQHSVRKLDVPCRYGGEEFAILLPSTPLLVAVQVAERLRGLVAQSKIRINGNWISATASLGVDTITRIEHDSPEKFVNSADKWLYKAKAAGRNCVRHGKLTRPKNHAISDMEKAALGESAFPKSEPPTDNP